MIARAGSAFINVSKYSLPTIAIEERLTLQISEFWYSTVVRSSGSVVCLDLSKSVLGWQRFCVWEGHDISKGVSTILALRCPPDTKSDLVLAFQDKGEMILRNSMILHAFLVQNALLKAAAFSKIWANPIYKWVRPLGI